MDPIQDYNALLANPLNEYFCLSEEIGGVVLDQAVFVKRAFFAQRDFLNEVRLTPKPDQRGIQEMLKPMSDAIQEIDAHREKNRQSEYFNHLSTVSEAITILGWVVIYPDPVKYARELRGSGAYYGNKVITAFKNKSTPDVTWAKAWLNLLTELEEIIVNHYRCSLNWNCDADKAGIFSSLPPPPPPPPVEDFAAFGIGTLKESDPRMALLRDLNKGVDITKRLKKVDKSAIPQKGYLGLCASVQRKPTPVVTHRPRLELDGRKWCVEYQTGDDGILIQSGSMTQCAYIYKCHDCTINVRDKVNCITIDSCSKIFIAFDDLVSSLEILNCKKVKAQSLGKMPTLVIDKSEGIMVYLSRKSMDVEIISSKSSELNICVPETDTEAFEEHAVPEQLKTTVVDGKLRTVAVEKM